MSVVKSKVVLVERKGPSWTNKHNNEMFPFEYTFEDRVVLTANHQKEKSPFNQGDEVEYEIKDTSEQWGNKGTVKKPGSSDFRPGNKGNQWYGSEKHLEIERWRQKAIIMQSSISNAINFNASKSEGTTLETILSDADSIYKHVMDKSTGKKE